MRRYFALSVASLAVVFLLSFAIPAIGGPQAFSSANPVKLAKKALKTAKKADSRAKKAQAAANQVLAKVSRNGGFLAANVQTVVAPAAPIAPGQIGSASAACPAGTVVISGGYSLTGSEASAIFDHKSGNGWAVGVDNIAAGGTGGTQETAQVVVEAQCAGTANAVIARSARADRERDQRLLERQRALRR